MRTERGKAPRGTFRAILLACALVSTAARAAHEPPTITSPEPAAAIGEPTVTVVGTAPGDVVEVRVFEGATLRAATGPRFGWWTVGIGFADGPHTIHAVGVDGFGASSGPSETVTFTVDTVAPGAPSITGPPTGVILAFADVTIEGSAEPGSDVRVEADTGAILETRTAATGRWAATWSFTDTTHTVVARATDPAGNTSLASPAVTFTVDTRAPAPPGIDVPGNGVLLRSPTVEVAGSAEPRTTVTVSEGAALGVFVIGSNGRWTVTRSFTDGLHTVEARARDAAGHSSPSSATTFRIDSTAPAAPVITSPQHGVLLPAAVTIAGSAEARSTVELYEDTLFVATTAAGPHGDWSVSLRLLSGPHPFRARSRDEAGNTGLFSAPREFTVDADAPAVHIATADGSLFLPTQPARIDGEASDIVGVEKIQLRYYDLFDNVVGVTTASCAACPDTRVTWFTTFSPGQGRFVVRAIAFDRVGNGSAARSITILRI